MQCVQPYETDYGYYSANGDNKDGSEIFKMSGNTYTNGFKLDINRQNGTCALFNLNGEYTRLEFDLGHIDGSGDDKLYLKIIQDKNISKIIEKQFDELPTHYSIDVTGTKQLIFDSMGESATMWGSYYGLANMYLYK